jgi:hypothetical protein
MKLLAALLAILGLAEPGASQHALRSDALYLLPQESRLVAFVDLQALRATPHYDLVRQRLLTPRLAAYERFLRSLGIDPDKDLDWVAWVRAPIRAVPGREVTLGIARGRFRPERAEQFFLQQRLPIDAYRGQSLFPYRGERGAQDFSVTFLDATTIAFGRRAGLELMLETRFGGRPDLSRNQALISRVNEVNERAPAWAVFDAQATPGAVRRLFPEVAKFDDFARLAGSFRSSALQITFGRQLSLVFQVTCSSAADAGTFSHLLQTGLLAQSWQAQRTRPELGGVLARVEVTSAGEQVEARVTLEEREVPALLERR